MKLDYATLISPYPLYLQNIGSIKSPTLREIWDPKITYNGYNMYLSLLLMDLQTYCEKVCPQLYDWYSLLTDEEKLQINMFDLIVESKELQEQFRRLFDFFFVENVFWDDYSNAYYTYVDKDEKGKVIPVGIINKEFWSSVCDVILKRCCVNRDEPDNIEESKVKNKRALVILQKFKKWRQSNQKKIHDRDTDLPNLISKVSVMAKSINYTNIWDLTVFQLYEQFRQECTNVYFNIKTMSVAAWGNENNTFKGNEWYKNEN